MKIHHRSPNTIHPADPIHKKTLVFIGLILCLLGCRLISNPAPSSSIVTTEPLPPQTNRETTIADDFPPPSVAPTFTNDSLAPLPIPRSDLSAVPIWGINNWQQIDISAEQIYRLQLNGRTTASWGIIVVPTTNSQLDTTIELRGSGGQTQTIDEQGVGEIEVMRFTADSTGEYTISIRPSTADSAGTAHLETFAPNRLTPQIDLTDQVALGEIKRYPISVPPHTPLLIELTPEGFFDPIFEIYADDSFLRHFDQGTNGEAERFIGLYQETAVEYLIVVAGFQGSSGSYRLTATSIPLSIKN